MEQFSWVENGKLRFRLHDGQVQAWDSEKRFPCVLAGTQGGKTCFGPLWLLREIKQCGVGDYLVVTPSYPLLQKKALPEFRRIFERQLGLGKYNGQLKQFVVSDRGEVELFGSKQDEPTIVHFGHAADPDSLESATAKAAWCDEAGQKKFKLASWEAVLRRLSIHEGRALITTTPYDFGWLKLKIWDAFEAGDELIDVIQFESRMNPAFPQAEWDRAKRDLPGWKFDLFYRARFTRPAGLIYDNFDIEPTHPDVIAPFPIPETWERYIGVDFGGINTVALFYAREPGLQKYYLYREYVPRTQRRAQEHVAAVLAGEWHPVFSAGGSKSEENWRNEWEAAGLQLAEPAVKDVEVGINRVYGMHARKEIKVFNTCTNYLAEKGSYSRPVDEFGNVMDGIEDKSSFHCMDAERYIMGHLAPDTALEVPEEDFVEEGFTL